MSTLPSLRALRDAPPTEASRPRPTSVTAGVVARPGLTGAALVALAFVLHLAALPAERVVWGDEPFYLWLGRNWFAGDGYQMFGFRDFHHPPGYPFLTGLVDLVVRDLATASEVVYLVTGPLLVLPVLGIARRLYDPIVGWVAAGLIAVWPALNLSVPVWGTMTEPPFLLFVATGLWAAVVAVQDGLLEPDATARPAVPRPGRAPLLAGLCLGLAYLVRPEASLYLAAIGLVLVVLAARRRRWREGLVLVASFGLGFALCFGPYAFYTRVVTGSWMVSQKVGITYLDAKALARHDLAEHDRVLWGLDSTGERVNFFSEDTFDISLARELRENPGNVARMVRLNVESLLRRFLSPQGFPKLLLPALGVGVVVGLLRDWRRRRGEWVLVAALAPPLSFLLFFIFPRYLAPLLIPLVVWTALGLVTVASWLRRLLVRRWGRVWWRHLASLGPVLAAALAVLAMAAPKADDVPAASSRPLHRAVGEWLGDHVAPEASVMSRYPAVAFHAERQWYPSAAAGYEETLRYTRANGVDYWVADETDNEYRPALAFLTEQGPPPPELEEVLRVQDELGTIVVYRLVDAGAASA